jgi:glycosyltransferase involved in cell wall biosynthesis
VEEGLGIEFVKSKPRIIIIGGVPPPHHGVTVYVQSLLNSELAQEFDIHHLDTSDHRSLDNLGRLDFINVYLAARSVLGLCVMLRRVRPHLVYVPISTEPLPYLRDGLFMLCTKWMSSARLVIHLHGGAFFREHFYERSTRLLRLFLGWTLRKVDTAIVLGTNLLHVFDGLVKYTVVVPNGSDFSSGSNGERNKDTSPENIIVGFLGKFLMEKGVIDVLEAARVVLQKYPGVRFHFAGWWCAKEPGTMGRALRMVKEYGLEQQAIFREPVFDGEKEQFLLNTDIFAFPSWNEGAPLVILEAMAAGCAVISTRGVGAIDELIDHGRTGLLIEKQNVKELAESIVTLIEQPLLRKRLGRAAKQKFEAQYTMHHNVKVLAGVLHKTLQIDQSENVRSRRPILQVLQS